MIDLVKEEEGTVIIFKTYRLHKKSRKAKRLVLVTIRAGCTSEILMHRRF